MKQVGIFEAKTHLSSLVDEVEKGGEIVITRHGKPVAKLVRAEERLSPEAARTTTQGAARNFGRSADGLKLNLTHDEIKAWIEEGRH